MFNLCDALYSGFYFFKEECASSLLGYILTPLAQHNLGQAPLIKFLQSIPDAGKFKSDIDNMLAVLQSDGDIKWSQDLFPNDPFNRDFNCASALEYAEIDLIIKVKDTLLLFENKINPQAIKNIGEQIAGYHRAIADRGCRIVPIAVFPDEKALRSSGEYISLVWNEPDKNHLGLKNFLDGLIAEHPQELASLKEYNTFCTGNFQSSLRPTEKDEVSVAEVKEKFSPEYRDLIDRLFPSQDKCRITAGTNGCSLIYQMDVKDDVTIWPFRLLPDKNILDINYQGLRCREYCYGKSFYQKHTIRSLISSIIAKKCGWEFINKYQIPLYEINDSFIDAISEVRRLLVQIIEENWTKAQLTEKFLSVSNEKLDIEKFSQMLEKCRSITQSDLEKNPALYAELYHQLSKLN